MTIPEYDKDSMNAEPRPEVIVSRKTARALRRDPKFAKAFGDMMTAIYNSVISGKIPKP